MEIKCKRKKCEYVWVTKSTHFLVSCPSCGIKNKIKEFKEVVENAPQDKHHIGS